MSLVRDDKSNITVCVILQIFLLLPLCNTLITTYCFLSTAIGITTWRSTEGDYYFV